MKKIKFYLLTLVIGSALIIGGCGDDNPVDPGPGGTTASGNFTLNGGGYDNQTINITAGGAEYDPAENRTGVALYGVAGNDTTTVVLIFPGNQTGTFNFDIDSSFAAFYTNLANYYISSEGSTTITTYGSVGNNISGTFSHTVSNVNLTDNIEINGTFSARRIPDATEN
jgi:hypothetical protein